MKTYISQAQLNADLVDGNLSLHQVVHFTFNVNINGSIEALGVYGKDIKCNELKAKDVRVDNVIANEVDVNFMTATSLMVKTANIEISHINSIEAYHFKSTHIYCDFITSHDIYAETIQSNYVIQAENANVTNINGGNVVVTNLFVDILNSVNVSSKDVRVSSMHVKDTISAHFIVFSGFVIAGERLLCKSLSPMNENAFSSCLKRDIKFFS